MIKLIKNRINPRDDEVIARKINKYYKQVTMSQTLINKNL